MENKTIDEFVTEYFLSYKTSKKSFKQLAIDAGKAYASQQVEIAVKKALEMASDGAIVLPGGPSHQVDKQSILSLTDKVINELNK